jgi:hypothetical protein
MTKIEMALARLRELPPEDQEAIAEMILGYPAEDYDLTPEQWAEIERRVADPDPKYYTSEEVWAHFKPRGV